MTTQQQNPHKASAAPLVIGLALLLMLTSGIALIVNQRSTPALVESTLTAPQSRIRIQHIPAEPETRLTSGFVNTFDASIRTQFDMQPEVQEASGLAFRASNFVLRDDLMFINVCYQQPGMGVWDIHAATLDYRTGQTSHLTAHETYIEPVSGIGQMGQRCLALEFRIPSQADLSHLTLTIHRIGMVAPAEGRECAVYSARLANAAAVRDANITAECIQQTGGVQLRVVTRPESMSLDEAEALIGKAVRGEIEGPWVFTDDLSQ